MYDSWAIGTREACVKVRPGARRRGDRERESGVFLSLSFEIGTLLEDCLRVRKSGAIRVLVALVRMIREDNLWLVGPRLHDVATGGVRDSFVLLPRILGCWGSFERAFLPGRLVYFF
jgi:hypothetical protein